MFDDLKAYFYENVLAAYNRYAEVKADGSSGASRDLHAAINAAYSLYHLREHIPSQWRKSRKELTQLCPDYDVLGDVVNAAKHKTLTRGDPLVVSAEDIFEEVIITKYTDELGDFSDTEKKVLVRLRNGSIRDIAEIFVNVLNMWFGELYAIGVLSVRQTVPRKPNDITIKKNRREATPSNLEITAGIRFRQAFKFQKYDDETGRIEPLDLSQAQSILFTVRQPRYELEVALQNAVTGETISRTVQLTQDQSREFSQLTLEIDKVRFVAKIAQQQQQVVEEIITEIRHRSE